MKKPADIRRARLAQLISERYKSQADFVSQTGENQGEVSALLRDKSFGEKKARSIEAKCKLEAGWLDVDISTGGASMQVERGQERRRSSGVSALHPDDELPDQVVYVPESKIEFSAGPGSSAGFEIIEDNEPATYRLSWFQKYGINPDRVKRFRVSGDSMEPMLFARDTILVNTDETHVIDGKLYAIRYGDELRVKYLSRRLDGTMILRSANPAYKPEELSPELANEHITVIGRVRDKSGTGGL